MTSEAKKHADAQTDNTAINLDTDSLKVAIRETKDGTVGNIKVAFHDYKKNRPEGLDDEAEKKVDDYRTAFVARVLEDAGAEAVKAMSENDELNKVVVKAKMGSLSLIATVHGEVDVSKGFGSKEKTKTFGRTNVRVKTPYGAKVGRVKTALERLEEAAKAALKK